MTNLKYNWVYLKYPWVKIGQSPKARSQILVNTTEYVGRTQPEREAYLALDQKREVDLVSLEYQSVRPTY